MASSPTERLEVGGVLFDYALVSRRGCDRTGARYETRGADPCGHVANFVESEQLAYNEAAVTAFVQTRGSIPLLWSQRAVGFRPKIMVVDSVFRDAAFVAHFEQQTASYGAQVLVNLVNHHGLEQALGEEYEIRAKLLGQLFDPPLRYVAWDFHEQCKHDHYEHISDLITLIGNDLRGFGVFVGEYAGLAGAAGNLTAVRQQTGCPRTNCIDCLDRTNVVQSVIARHVLTTAQLPRLGVAESILGDTAGAAQPLDAALKRVWSDNADRMSRQYTGTGALKTDYTRTGKRSVKGKLDDGVNSAKRYINSSFRDRDRQESLDLFLGKFVVDPNVDGDAVAAAIDDGHRFAVARTKRATSTNGEEAGDGEDGEDRKERRCWLTVDVATQSLGRITAHNGKRVTVPVAAIGQLVRGTARLPRQLTVVCNSEAESEDFVFASVRSREAFVSCVIDACQRGGLPPPPPFSLNWPRELSVWVGTWNAAAAPHDPTMLVQSLAGEHDVYVVAAQGIPADQRLPPRENWFGGLRSHWLYAVQARLGVGGNAYHLAAWVASEMTVTAVLVRGWLRSAVARVQPMSVHESKQEDKQARKRVKGKTARSSPPQAPATAEPAKKTGHIGAGVGLSIGDVSLCVANAYAPNAEKPLVLRAHRMVVNTSSEYHHVFWTGVVNSASLDRRRFIPLVRGEHTGDGGILHSTFIGGAAITNVSATRLTATSGHAPLYVSLKLAVPLPMPVIPATASAKTRAVVSFSRLAAEGLSPADVNGKADPYLIFYAQFAEERPQTKPVKKTLSPKWSEEVNLVSLVESLEYLKGQHVVIDVYDHDIASQDDIMGTCVVPLLRSAECEGDGVEFEVPITCDDQQCGILRGHVRIEVAEHTSSPSLIKLVRQQSHK